MSAPPVVLAVAGSDPSGGAGIQADLKTATTLGTYGAAAITSLTAQNTTGVSGIYPIPADFVARQYRSVVTDLDVRALKIGMLGTSDVVAALAESMREYPVPHVVLDPVMVAASGDRLVPNDVISAIRDQLLPLATMVTPNLAETAVLLDEPTPETVDQMMRAARRLLGFGSQTALVKGGHLHRGDSIDVLADETGAREFTAERVDTPNTHGTGCTLSSAIAAYLALGRDIPASVEGAKEYIGAALRSAAGWRLGAGSGPVDHLWDAHPR